MTSFKGKIEKEALLCLQGFEVSSQINPKVSLLILLEASDIVIFFNFNKFWVLFITSVLL